jgi:CheY-like chemotaxis protein
MTSILVVEKDADVCSFIAEALETELSASVICFSSAPLGLDAIDSGRFDLAIIEVGLAGISGLELARHSMQRNIPALLSSGDVCAIDQLRERGLPCLEKPFSLDSLIFAAAQAITEPQQVLDRVKAGLCESFLARRFAVNCI